MQKIVARVVLMFFLFLPFVVAASPVDGQQRPQDAVPVPLNAQKSNADSDEPGDEDRKEPHGEFLIVPIPFSNPTLDSGLVLGAGYFHAQTEAQAEVQPPSVTGGGVMYSGNGSYGGAVGNASYWGGDTWRSTAVAGYVDLDLPLLASNTDGELVDLSWLIRGSLLYSEISRRVSGDWYLGLSARYMDVEQEFSAAFPSADLVVGNAFNTVGMGLSMTWDTRDMPSNAYEGRYLRLNTFHNSESLGSDQQYDTYGVAFSSYHLLRERVVLAWQVGSCFKSGDLPLWDACRIALRGFPSTNYLGRSSMIGQFEARWRFSERWGVVGFAGAGRITESLSGDKDNDVIPSYGVGIRFMVQPENRVNMRLDYGRSEDDSAIYLSVGEAF